MKYDITLDPMDADNYYMRCDKTGYFLAGIHGDLLSDEIKDIVMRDGGVQVSFKLHFGDKK